MSDLYDEVAAPETVVMTAAELWALGRCELLYGLKGATPAPLTLKKIEPLLVEAFKAGEQYAKSGKAIQPGDFPENLQTEEFFVAWEEWVVYRAAAKKKLTPQTSKKQLKFLAEIGVDRGVAAIEHSIRQGYQGLFEPGNGKAVVKSQFQGLREFVGDDQ